jgi:hypothetical protein
LKNFFIKLPAPSWCPWYFSSSYCPPKGSNFQLHGTSKGVALAATLRSDHLMVIQKLFDQILKKGLQFAPVCDIIIIVNEKGKEKKNYLEN